jgi:hypothetical protein
MTHGCAPCRSLQAGGTVGTIDAFFRHPSISAFAHIQGLPMNLPTAPLTVLVPVLLAATAISGYAEDSLSIVPQVLVGTANLEPGLAIEYRPTTEPRLILRPEAFLSEDNRLGAGGSLLWDFSNHMRLPDQQSLAFGPRAVYHNSDDYGWEVSAMGVYGFDLGIDRAWRHSLEALAAVGAIRDRKHDDTDLSVAIGGAYAFRF